MRKLWILWLDVFLILHSFLHLHLFCIYFDVRCRNCAQIVEEVFLILVLYGNIGSNTSWLIKLLPFSCSSFWHSQAKQVARFEAESLLDDSNALEVEDGRLEDAEYQADQCSVDEDLLNLTANVCEDAVTYNNGLLGPVRDDILYFLKQKGLVQEFQTGEMALMHNCFEYGVCCGKPCLESNTRSIRTSLENEQELMTKGWTFVDAHKEASVQHKRAVRNNYQTYYNLLLNSQAEVLALEEEGFFHHKQSERYYQAVQEALKCREVSSFQVDAYKSAEYYSKVIQFLNGSLVTNVKLTIVPYASHVSLLLHC